MQLRARLFPLGDGSAGVLTSLLPSRDLVFESARCAVDVEDPVFQRILRSGDEVEGFWVSGEAVFSAEETEGITHFELVCRAIVRESKGDFEANDAVRVRTAPIDAGGEAPIRLPSGFSLSRISLKPTMVGSIGDWTAEYVVGSAVAAAFTEARLTGFSLRPITNPRTGCAHEGYFHLFSDELLGPAAIDDSVERIESAVAEENGRLRHLGCLSYADSTLVARPDFNRTAEPWGGWHGWPSWVVSARVMQIFRQRKFRGWHFRPVLTTESTVYSPYRERWRRLREAVRATTNSRLDGGRW